MLRQRGFACNSAFCGHAQCNHRHFQRCCSAARPTGSTASAGCICPRRRRCCPGNGSADVSPPRHSWVHACLPQRCERSEGRSDLSLGGRIRGATSQQGLVGGVAGLGLRRSGAAPRLSPALDDAIEFWAGLQRGHQLIAQAAHRPCALRPHPRIELSLHAAERHDDGLPVQGRQAELILHASFRRSPHQLLASHQQALRVLIASVCQLCQHRDGGRMACERFCQQQGRERRVVAHSLPKRRARYAPAVPRPHPSHKFGCRNCNCRSPHLC